jgi:hypothetical protein
MKASPGRSLRRRSLLAAVSVATLTWICLIGSLLDGLGVALPIEDFKTSAVPNGPRPTGSRSSHRLGVPILGGALQAHVDDVVPTVCCLPLARVSVASLPSANVFSASPRGGFGTLKNPVHDPEPKAQLESKSSAHRCAGRERRRALGSTNGTAQCPGPDRVS